MTQNGTPHPFITRPHRTMLALSFPVLLSLIAEPLTGLVDTAFVAQLGATAQAALGVGTAALSTVFWVFNFLGVGTQTEIAQAAGQDAATASSRATRINGLALSLSAVISLLVIVLGWPLAPMAARLLGATDTLQETAVIYMRIRLFGAPPMLAMLAAFGTLRGMQDMRTPLWIAVTVNAINIALDALLIPGWGAIPAMGISGAALASTIAQWIGGVWVVTAVIRRLGWPANLHWREAQRLLQIGGDLFVRTGLLTLYLLITTRVATRIGSNSGAAHQAIRQVWFFTALGLDALAITAQSLAGYFIGLNRIDQARRVALISSGWSFLLGILLAIGQWLLTGFVARWLIPETAVAVFGTPWLISAAFQPINALAFVTDGLHWGTGDFRFLRNVVMLATFIATATLLLVDVESPTALTSVWLTTCLWIAIRALLGMLRIWPGIGQSPYRK